MSIPNARPRADSFQILCDQLDPIVSLDKNLDLTFGINSSGATETVNLEIPQELRVQSEANRALQSLPRQDNLQAAGQEPSLPQRSPIENSSSQSFPAAEPPPLRRTTRAKKKATTVQAQSKEATVKNKDGKNSGWLHLSSTVQRSVLKHFSGTHLISANELLRHLKNQYKFSMKKGNSYYTIRHIFKKAVKKDSWRLKPREITTIDTILSKHPYTPKKVENCIDAALKDPSKEAVDFHEALQPRKIK